MSPDTPESPTFDCFMSDWQTCDFYKYNPLGSAGYMDYPTYRRKRLSGELPTPTPEELHDRYVHPYMEAPERLYAETYR